MTEPTPTDPNPGVFVDLDGNYVDAAGNPTEPPDYAADMPPLDLWS